jgi:hypothetical protein
MATTATATAVAGTHLLLLVLDLTRSVAGSAAAITDSGSAHEHRADDYPDQDESDEPRNPHPYRDAGRQSPVSHVRVLRRRVWPVRVVAGQHESKVKRH